VVLQIANPVVVGKVERLAADLGLNKTAAVERAVDLMLASAAPDDGVPGRMASILRQLDALPDLPGGGREPLLWDANGLPA